MPRIQCNVICILILISGYSHKTCTVYLGQTVDWGAMVLSHNLLLLNASANVIGLFTAQNSLFLFSFPRMSVLAQQYQSRLAASLPRVNFVTPENTSLFNLKHLIAVPDLSL